MMTALDQARYMASLMSGWNSEISASRVTPGRMTAGCAAASGPGGGGSSAGAAPARNMTGQFRRDVAIACLRFHGWPRIRQAGLMLVQPTGLPQQPVSRAHSGPNPKLTAASRCAPAYD